MAVSISDVAQRANVSISTVSRVVNGRNIVNAATRKRVEGAIRELGYRPNVFARGLMLRKSNILGLLLPDIHGEFYSEIIRGADQQARASNLHLVVSSVEMDDDGDAILSAVGDHGLLDGVVIMVADLQARARAALARLSIPMVVLDGVVAGVEHDNVLIDQEKGATTIMRHILKSGEVDRIVFVGGPESNIDSMIRLDACEQALAAASLQLAKRDLFHLDFQYASAYELASRRARNWAGPRCCVVAANDEMAAGIIQGAAAVGVSVPAELRVIGFDDTRIASMMCPKITTVRVPMSEMGSTAIELLIRRLEEPTGPVRTVTLKSRLIVRESCGLGRECAVKP